MISGLFPKLVLEIKQTFRLAAPLVIAQWLQVAMGVTDTIMLGRLSAEDLAAGGLGTNLWSFVLMASIGLAMALSTLFARLKGAGRDQDIGALFRQGFWLVSGIGLLAFLATRQSVFVLAYFDIAPDVIELSKAYLNIVAWGMPATCLYLLPRYLSEGIAHTKPIMLVQVVGLGINIIGNYMLIYGNWGAPALGVVGAAWSTMIVMCLSSLLLFIYIVISPRYQSFCLFSRFDLPDWREIFSILKLSTPIAISLIMEIGLFSTVALMMGKFGTNVVAAHQVAMNYATLMFMIPLGISMAIAVRVGLAAGEKKLLEARFRGWVGIGLSFVVMFFSALVMFLFPEKIISVYTNDNIVAELAVSFLFAAALFQMFDGIQVSAAGALRGLKDTKVPMIITMISYWIVGISVAWLMAFYWDKGPIGLWFGLIAGLVTAAILLIVRFYRYKF